MTDRSALVRHPLSIAGVLITTVSAVVFIALVIAAIVGLFNNPYAGLVVFVALPACFLVGLALIPLGMRLRRRQLARGDAAAGAWPVVDFRRASVRRASLIIVALTAVNVVILLVAGYGTLHWMESPTFCGQACHEPMHPQFTAWQQAPHARVACAECHIGEGAAGFVHAKMSGVRQLVHVVTNTYPRPIPPGVDMPSGQGPNCMRCHKPGMGTGDHVRVIREYADDKENTETLTVLQMHLGSSIASQRAIHWHADPAIRIEFVSTDEARQTIPYVRVTDANGSVREFRASDATDQIIASGHRRTMDCVDCHNTIGHPIAPTAEKAVDDAIAAAQVSRDLPFVRREGVRLLKESYADQDAGARAIEQGLQEFYTAQEGVSVAGQQALARSVRAFQDVYRRNVFPTMKVTWGAYNDNKGHITSSGCFRCHDDDHKAQDGSTINSDCSYCHTQIERPQTGQ